MRHGAALRFLFLLAALAAGCAERAPAAPRGPQDLRILSLTPNITEILFAMGLGDRVVGRSTFCTYPPAVTSVPAVGDTMNLSLEKVIRCEPTVAFMITRRTVIPRRLEGLGIRAVALDSDHMDQLLASIAIIGRETGREAAAEALLARLDAELRDVKARVAGLARPRVLFAFPMTVGSSRIMVAGRGTFVDELLTVAGAENVCTSRGDWPTVGPQQVVALAPEVVIVNAAGDDAPAGRADAIRAAWSNLPSVPAVARGRVHVLTEPFLTIPGPRVGQAARLLAATIHPELRAEGNP